MNASELASDSVSSGKDADGELNYVFSPDLVTLSDARLAEAEAIRTMRTHIMARHLDDGRRGVAMCSATKGAGCTFLATNLGYQLAETSSVLLIDLN